MNKKYAVCDHIGMFTHDADRLVQFYTDALDFQVTSDSTLSKSIVNGIFGIPEDCRFLKMQKEGFLIEILEPLAKTIERSCSHAVGINHWGYCVENRNAFVMSMREKKQNIVEINRNGRAVYFLIDPDGNRIEVREAIV